MINNNRLKVGICYNHIKNFPYKKNQPEDIDIEWTGQEYIDLLVRGLEQAGFQVVDIGSPKNLLSKKVLESFDILFSIAEMLGYRFREILVPTICEMYDKPYLFAQPDAMLITADKYLSNIFVNELGINIPKSLIIKDISETDILQSKLEKLSFPLIIKPNAEGASMGINKESVIFNINNLKQGVKRLLSDYDQPVLIQEFIEGMEITIGVIQKQGETTPMTPLITFNNENEKSFVFDINMKSHYKKNKLFKPLLDNSLSSIIQKYAVDIFDKIGCLDAARIDFRISNGNIYFNPLLRCKFVLRPFCIVYPIFNRRFQALKCIIRIIFKTVKKVLCIKHCFFFLFDDLFNGVRD